MTILTALAAVYERLAEEGRAPPRGYSNETIHHVIDLRPDGSVASVSALGAGGSGRLMPVPQAVKRSQGVVSNFLWDKTSYALGVAAARQAKETAGDHARRIGRLPEMHAAFVDRHRERLGGTDDEGLAALLRFLDGWRPEAFKAPLWPDEMRGRNVVFALESERLDGRFLHDRPAARSICRDLGAASGGGRICLVSGARGPVARLHPSISGVWGAHSAGASLVSFNLAASESNGAKQGDNAQVSEAAAFAYATALNALLEKGSRNRLQIGDASTVFWADASGAAAERIERLFGALMQDGSAETGDAETGRMLTLLRLGRAEEALAGAPDGVRLHVLGLAPNTARLSVRFWISDDFGRIAANFADFARDMAIDPPPTPPLPAFWSLLRALAAQGASERVPPGLAGEWIRAVLTGARYPQTLLMAAVMRARVEKDVGARRAAILRAVLRRNHGWEAPVALDPDNPSHGYQLGRLLAVLDQAQRAAFGPVNTTVADRHYAAASASPARAFGPLLHRLQTHISEASRRGQGRWIKPKIGRIMAKLGPDLPVALSLEDQARFAIGYYHEKATRPGKSAAAGDGAPVGQEGNPDE